VFLVVAPEEGHVDLKTLHHKLGAGRFSFGSAALLEELLGVAPGAVTAFGAINDNDQGHHHPDLREGRHRGIEAPAGADRLLGAVVRALQAAHADLEKAVRAAKGKVKLVKMNIDEHPAIPGQMGIQSIPAVIAFVNGQPADGFMGAVPESQVNAFIDKLTKGMPAAASPRIRNPQRGRGVLAEGDPPPRRRSMPRCWRRRHQHRRRSRGWRNATCDRRDRAGQADARAWCRNPKRNDAAVKAVQAAIDLAEQAKSLGPVGELEQKVAANPLDHQARFDLATALNAAASAARRPISCSRSSSATANGTRTARASSWCSSSRRGADRRGHRRRPQAAVDDPVFVALKSRFSAIAPIAGGPAERHRDGTHMPINAEYRGPGELPEIIPVFPLPGALLLPRGQMPLNIFEPRYLAMVDDALRDGHRLIGMIQPDAAHPGTRTSRRCFGSAASAASPSSPNPATAATSSSSPASRASR
jgi:hypothetical protein